MVDVRLLWRAGRHFGDAASDLKLALLSAELRREPVCAGDSGGVPMSHFTCKKVCFYAVQYPVRSIAQSSQNVDR